MNFLSFWTSYWQLVPNPDFVLSMSCWQSRGRGYVRIAHLYVSQSQQKSTGVRGALGRARYQSNQGLPLRT